MILHVKVFFPLPPEPTALRPTGNRSIGNGPLREDPSWRHKSRNCLESSPYLLSSRLRRSSGPFLPSCLRDADGNERQSFYGAAGLSFRGQSNIKPDY